MVSQTFIRRAGLFAAVPAVGLLSGCFNLTINSQAPAPRHPQPVEIVQSSDQIPVPTWDAVPATTGTVADTSPQSPHAYDLDFPAQTSPNIRIRRVEFTPDATLITVSFRADTVDSIQTGRPGDDEAFYLRDAESTREWELRAVDGIALAPEITDVAPGEEVRFRLRFASLPSDVRRFHLLESKLDTDASLVYWRFLDVPVK